MAAAGQEGKKVVKYSNSSENYHFVPVGIESYGAYSQAIKLITQIGKKIQEATGEKLSTFYLKQYPHSFFLFSRNLNFLY